MLSRESKKGLLVCLCFLLGLGALTGCATRHDPEAEMAFQRVDIPIEERVLVKQQMKHEVVPVEFRYKKS